MFFPIFIGPAPTGKLGLLYCGTLLAFAGVVYFGYAKPIMDYEVANNPRFQLAAMEIDRNAAEVFSSWIPYTILVVGVLITIVVGYELYKYKTVAA